MNQRFLLASLLSMSIAYSAVAAAGYYDAVGEGYGRTKDEAYQLASYRASNSCRDNWGEPTQEQTILVEEYRPSTEDWYVKLSEKCLQD